MSFNATTKRDEVEAVIRRQGGVAGVYALAKLLDRPYKRVREHVQALAAAGRVELVESRQGGRRVTVIRPGSLRRRPPELSYSRHWSSPVTGVDDTVLIAGVIAEPTLEDLITCCLHYGMPRVREVFQSMLSNNEISPLTQRMVGRMLANVEIGFSRVGWGAAQCTRVPVPKFPEDRKLDEAFLAACKAQLNNECLVSRDLYDLKVLLETGRYTLAELFRLAVELGGNADLARECLVSGRLRTDDPAVNLIDGSAINVESLRNWFVEQVNEYERAVAAARRAALLSGPQQ